VSKIRASAKGETCTFKLPGICNFNPETVVLCHAPHPDKGMGIKGPDTWAAYGCSSCHDAMEGRNGKPYMKGDIRAHVIWYEAIRETQRRLIAKGLMPK
jgi:hypothetical protein